MRRAEWVPAQLLEWLRDNGAAGFADRGGHPLSMFTWAASRRGMPPIPDKLLFIWSVVLTSNRIVVLQGTVVFVRSARRSGLTDEQIRRALLLDEGADLDQHCDALQAEVRQIQEKQPLVWPPDDPDRSGSSSA